MKYHYSKVFECRCDLTDWLNENQSVNVISIQWLIIYWVLIYYIE